MDETVASTLRVGDLLVIHDRRWDSAPHIPAGYFEREGQSMMSAINSATFHR